MSSLASDFVSEGIVARRSGYALTYGKVISIVGLIGSVVLAVMWLFQSQYTQLILMSVSILPTVITAALIPQFHSRNHTSAGMILALTSVLIAVVTSVYALPNIMVPRTVAFLIVMTGAYLTLGDKYARRGAFISAILMMFISSTTVHTDFLPLDESLANAINLLLIFATVVVFVLLVRVLTVSQEREFERAQQSAKELEHRMVQEQEQYERLQRANEEVQTHAAQEQAQRQQLQGMFAQIREVAAQLNEVAAAITGLTTQQNAAVTEQNAAVTQTMATVEELRVTVRQTADRAKVVADNSRESANVSRTGQAVVNDAMQGMRTIQEKVENIAQTILLLSERTQQIGEIIMSVSEISEQSKLLALNASIEAARAGEEGKGFAVVAMEVRQLAEQSREATTRVRDILNQIQQATNTAVMVTEEGSKWADTGLGLVEKAGQVIAQLSQTIEASAQTAGQIAASASQQTNGMDQLSVAMSSIKQTTVQTASSTREAERNAHALTDMARQLQQSMSGAAANS
jgi:methyl-accepting chemotaxis protein